MDKTIVSVANTTVQVPVSTVNSANSLQGKTRLNLNQNFILVPAGSTNLLANNGNVSNLIATHHNSIVNKGKIMILTTAPQVGSSGNATGAANLVGQVIRPGAPNQSTSATLTLNNNPNMINITNIKMAPGSTLSSNIQNLTNSTSGKTPTIQVLTPAISNANRLQAVSINNSGQIVKPISASPSTKPRNSSSVNKATNSGIKSKTTNQASTSATANGTNISSESIVTKDLDIMSNDNDSLKTIPMKTIDLESENEVTMNDEANEIENVLIEKELNSFTATENKMEEGLNNKNKDQKLFSDELLDRSSPELWPEPVPGVVKFLAGTSPTFQFDDDYSRGISTVKSANSNVKNEINDDEDDSIQFIHKNEHGDSVKKFSKSFAITPYGLESNFDDQSSMNNNDDSGCNSPTGSTSTNGGGASTTVNKTNTTKPANIPEWQRDMDEEEIAMLYGYGSLTASSLLDKVKEIQNLAYQLGLEEEREITRARFLNVLSDSLIENGDLDGHNNQEVGCLFPADLDDIEKAITPETVIE